MRIHASSIAPLLAAGMLVLGAPAASRGQAAPTGTFGVAGEVAPRTYFTGLDPLAVGKFEEYRDMRANDKSSLLFQQLFLNYTPADSFGVYALSARKLFDRDQSIYLRAARPASYDFQLRWDRIPHTYSTTARSPGDELSHPGFNTLPLVRPDSTAWRNAPYIGRIRNQWDPVKASLTMTPNEHLDFKAEYTRIAKQGGIPRSISFSGSSGPQREYVSPIDQTVSDMRVSQSFASGENKAREGSFLKSYQVSVSLGYSSFRNAIKSTLVDNPQISVNSRTNGAAAGRVSLEPSNSAQTAAVTGAVLLPLRTRFTGSLTSTWMRQNDVFLPQTSNDSLKAVANASLVSTLMRLGLEGKARTTSYNLSGTSHPLSKVTLSLRHRSYDLSNQTPPFQIQAMVVSDRSIALGDSEKFEPHPFTKTNTDASASYQIARGLAVSAGYLWEDWKRDPEVRNLAKTSEKTPRASIDYTGIEWFTLRASYSSGTKRGSAYTTSATEIANFRRFDEADRDRTRMTIMGSLTPIDAITLGLTVQTGDDKFPNSQYGIVADKSTMTGVDLDWSPTERFGASVGWSHESVKDSANYRYRTGAVGSATYDNASYRWMNTNKDKNTTWYAAINGVLIPEKLEFEGTWSVIDSKWLMLNRNVTTPTGGTAAQNLNATAQDWPEVSQRLTPLSFGLSYQYSGDWALTFKYQWEKYDQTDFRTVSPTFTTNSLNDGTPITQYWTPGDLPGTIGQVSGSNTGQYHFLGNNFHPYKVDWVTLMFTYRPSLLQWARGRSTL